MTDTKVAGLKQLALDTIELMDEKPGSELDFQAGFVAGWMSANEWSPIETAPTDGSAILVSNGRGVWMAKHKAVFQSGYKPDNPWFCLMLNRDHIPRKLRAGKPTHWMPLPDAPNLTSDGMIGETVLEMGLLERAGSCCQERMTK